MSLLIPIPDLETVNVVKGGYLQFCTLDNTPNTIFIDYNNSEINILSDRAILFVERSIKIVTSILPKPTTIRKVKIIINTQSDINIFISNEISDNELLTLLINNLKTYVYWMFN